MWNYNEIAKALRKKFKLNNMKVTHVCQNDWIVFTSKDDKRNIGFFKPAIKNRDLKYEGIKIESRESKSELFIKQNELHFSSIGRFLWNVILEFQDVDLFLEDPYTLIEIFELQRTGGQTETYNAITILEKLLKELGIELDKLEVAQIDYLLNIKNKKIVTYNEIHPEVQYSYNSFYSRYTYRSPKYDIEIEKDEISLTLRGRQKDLNTMDVKNIISEGIKKIKPIQNRIQEFNDKLMGL